MSLFDDREFFWRIKWHWVLLAIGCLGMIIGLLGKLIGLIPSAASFSSLMIALCNSLFVIAAVITAFGFLVFAYEITVSIRDNDDKLTAIASLLKDQKDILNHINQDIQMSNLARSIAFRDSDKAGLREAVLKKLHKHNFEDTEKMLKEIALSQEFADFANELYKEVENYRNASVDERIAQIINYISKLMEDLQWVKAAEQIEQLIKSHPESEKAKNMPRILRERKDAQKKMLLAEWDQSVKRQDVDKSLAILKELDLYLTPNEGLALQESARDAFRTKLHNLGVEFSMEVADKQWDKAIITGEIIIKDFPNSKMATEIRNKIDVIKDIAQKQIAQKIQISASK